MGRPGATTTRSVRLPRARRATTAQSGAPPHHRTRRTRRTRSRTARLVDDDHFPAATGELERDGGPDHARYDDEERNRSIRQLSLSRCRALLQSPNVVAVFGLASGDREGHSSRTRPPNTRTPWSASVGVKRPRVSASRIGFDVPQCTEDGVAIPRRSCRRDPVDHRTPTEPHELLHIKLPTTSSTPTSCGSTKRSGDPCRPRPAQRRRLGQSRPLRPGDATPRLEVTLGTGVPASDRTGGQACWCGACPRARFLWHLTNRRAARHLSREHAQPFDTGLLPGRVPRTTIVRLSEHHVNADLNDVVRRRNRRRRTYATDLVPCRRT